MFPNPTELEILKVLWQREPRTAREIHNEIEAQFQWTYSSTRKTLERMGEKKFIEIGSQGNKKTFAAILKKVPTLGMYAQNFAKNVLELKHQIPIAMFADSQLIDSSELDELEAYLDELAKSDGSKGK